eukprot:TRINITY_DN16857_c0_g1_i1.p1 TRINITY_DN16857_c0_g1~~TRINITY_DN16857_c0_g1_i1.p1  ORF type:complete len:219 (+),score=44.84 TRINITY_DN16857_c0_g1_i1:29-658(+)
MADRKFAMVMAGESETGRVDVLTRFTDGVMASETSEEEIDFKTKTITVNSQKIQLVINDTAGQERFRAVTSSYYRRAHAVLIVYDIGDDLSFRTVNNWIRDVKLYSKTKIVTALIGNRCHLPPEKRLVSREDANQTIQSEKIDLFYEVSAETGENIEQAFMGVAKLVLERFGNEASTTATKNPNELMVVSDGGFEKTKTSTKKSGPCLV